MCCSIINYQPMFNSVRTKLTLWFTGVLAILLLLFAALTYLLFADTLRRNTDQTLSELSAGFQNSVAREMEDGGEEDELNREQSRAVQTRLKFFRATREAADNLTLLNHQIFVFDKAQNLVGATPALAKNKQAPNFAENLRNSLPAWSNELVRSNAEQMFSIVWFDDQPFRVTMRLLNSDGESYFLIVVHPLTEEREILRRVFWALLVAVPLSLAAAGAGGYFLARKSLSPVLEMSRHAAQINHENLSLRLPVKNERDELGALAIVFNALLSRLDQSFANQRRFMADASHELRTPLAIVRGESEIALSKPERAAQDYRESLEIVFDESKRMSKIIEDLFTLARADAGELPLRQTELQLDELLGDSVRAVRVLAEKKKIEIQSHIADKMLFVGDDSLLRRMFLNLLDNAVKYNRPHGTVKILAERNADYYIVSIENTGEQIAAEAQPRIFERFFRADNARLRSETATGSGAGLGLSIALWIAEVHGVTLKLVESDASGTKFQIVFLIPPEV